VPGRARAGPKCRAVGRAVVPRATWPYIIISVTQPVVRGPSLGTGVLNLHPDVQAHDTFQDQGGPACQDMQHDGDIHLPHASATPQQATAPANRAPRQP